MKRVTGILNSPDLFNNKELSFCFHNISAARMIIYFKKEPVFEKEQKDDAAQLSVMSVQSNEVLLVFIFLIFDNGEAVH